jgi:hypothetical protein
MRHAPLVSVLLAAALLVGCAQSHSPAAPSSVSSATVGAPLGNAAVVSNTTIPIPPNRVLFDSCTNEGVLVTGEIHVVTTTTLEANGGTHTEMHFNVEDVSGIGLVTGIHYRGIHTETHSSNASGSGASESTTVIDIKLIAEGSAANLTLQATLIHMTTNANGTETSVIDNMTVGRCQ